MLLRSFSIMILCFLNSGCFLFTGALTRKAEPTKTTYLVSKVTGSMKSKEILYLCFEGYIERNGGESYYSIDPSRTSNYIALFDFNNFGYNDYGNLFNTSVKVIESKCDSYFNTTPEATSISIMKINRNVECSIDMSCAAFNWSLVQNDHEILNGKYNKNTGINSYSLHTGELIKELSLKHDADEVIYDIMGKDYTKDKDAPRSVYYRNKHIASKYGPIYMMSLSNVLEGGAPYLYALAPATIAIDVITFPIQAIIVLNAVGDIGK